MDTFVHGLPVPRFQLHVRKTSPDARLNNYTVNVLQTQKETSFVLLCKHAQLCQNRKVLHNISLHDSCHSYLDPFRNGCCCHGRFVLRGPPPAALPLVNNGKLIELSPLNLTPIY